MKSYFFRSTFLFRVLTRWFFGNQRGRLWRLALDLNCLWHAHIWLGASDLLWKCHTALLTLRQCRRGDSSFSPVGSRWFSLCRTCSRLCRRWCLRHARLTPGRFIVILVIDKFRGWHVQVAVHWRLQLQRLNHGCYWFSSLQSHFFRGFAAENAEFVASVFEHLATGACAWCATATCFFTLFWRRLLRFHLVLWVHNFLLQCTFLIRRSDLENSSNLI